MTMSLAIPQENAKNETEGSFGNRRRALRLNADLMRKSRDLFSVKTAHHLSDITGYSVRSCEAWLSEKVVIPSDALAELLHSEWGREFLSMVMADNRPRWWKKLTAWFEAIDYAVAERKLRRKKRQLLERLADESQTYGPATSFAEMLHDPEFYGAQLAPTGRNRRALDSKRGKVK